MWYFRSSSASCALGIPMLLAGSLLLASQPVAQTALPPAPSDTVQGAEPPIKAQAPTEALNKLEDALKAARAAGDSNAEAAALNRIGETRARISDFPGALDSYNQALALVGSQGNARPRVAALNGIANCYRGQGENQKALEIYQQALDLAASSKDEQGQATALNGIGTVNSNMGQNQEALKFHNQALALAQKVGDGDLEAAILNRIGIVYDTAGEGQKALESYNSALTLWRAASDPWGEANTLTNIGVVYAEGGDTQKALDLYNQALPLRRAAGDSAGEAATLNNVGVLYKHRGEMQKALDTYSWALALMRAAGNRGGEAAALNNIGNVASDLGQKQEALDDYTLALALRRALGDGAGQAGTLNNIGGVYIELGEEQKALDYLNQALPLWRAAGEKRGEATTLNAIGVVYDDLGQPEQALDYYNQALAIRRATGNSDGEAETLNNIAGVYSAPAEKQKALEYYNQALTLERASGDKDSVARTLNNMGLVYEDLGEKQKAMDFYNEALPIDQEVGDRGGEASTLNHIGSLWDDLGEKQKALSYYTQALPLAIAVQDPIREAQIYRNLMLNLKSAQPALAIFYGKQAVNLLQQVRGNIQGLDKKLQAGFLASKTEYYRDLAGLLIAQGRLPEAEQVLDVLKQQEYSDYVRGDAASTLSPLALTPAEVQAGEDYQKSTAQIIALGEQWAQLKKNTARTAEEDAQFQQLTNAIQQANEGLSGYYARLYVLFGSSDANKQVADVQGHVSGLKKILAGMPRTAALYTLVDKDRLSILVVTGSAVVAREFVIPESELNEKVAAFETALRAPAQDPRGPAQELYKILIGPVKADLDQAHAGTLVWSLDGVLRYVPMAALYDGKQYLVESYNSVTITPDSIPNLAAEPDVSKLSVAAMGISRQFEQDLPPLPAVILELEGIVKDAGVPGAKGVLPGTILLDGQFTERAMESQLGGQHTVVHIASHFVFKPGSDKESYLLLAGKDASAAGFHLTVADFRNDPNLELDDTDLLTLSACDTGMSSSAANGREVDGLGTAAQRKGAKTVISSLWGVNDESTGELMADFYRRWAAGHGKVEKVEALRQAQLDLLLGKAGANSDARGRGFEPAGPDAQANFAHPYYWAPFVLMGNWR
ncbi:MAG: tetratricopeptide repeat protein [Terracidiphilus sp.]|jgi:CHAT domain-containing protein/tetratricopeptide (TPR) repeat protein